MKPVYVIIDYPCSEGFLELRRKKIVAMVTSGMSAIIARHGTNKTTLKKILRDYIREVE